MTNSNKKNQKNNEALQDRFALRTVSYLAGGSFDLPHNIEQRLRAARFQAVAARKITRFTPVTQTSGEGSGFSLTWNEEKGAKGWSLLASFMPLLLLLAGLLLINSAQSDSRAQEIAEIDVALLTDALPPEAFTDPGFSQFLKSTP